MPLSVKTNSGFVQVPLTVTAGGGLIVDGSMDVNAPGTFRVFSDAVVLGAVGTTTLGFFGLVGTARPDITGAKGANAALTDLLTKLEAMGLLTDSTT